MDFDSPDVMKEFPGLYTTDLNKKCTNDSDFSDENERITKKDTLINKRKEKKDKDKGYAALEGEESSADENNKSKSPSKSKKTKPFKFTTKTKEKREKSREKDSVDRKKDRDKKCDKKVDKSKCEKSKKLKQTADEIVDIADVLPVFGVSLEVAIERSPCHDGLNIPLPLRNCIDYIELFGHSTENLYKVSGTKSKILYLRKMYNQRRNVDLSEYDIPTITGLLKMFIRDLPEPLFTNELLIRFEEAGAILTASTREKHLKTLIDHLPPLNKQVLSWLFTHFVNMAGYEKYNKMNKQSLASALNHTFHCSSRLMNAIIMHCNSLFPDVAIIPYIPPLRSGCNLPEEPDAIKTELKKQESLLSQIHKEMNVGCISKQSEELLWEVQRIITQLKRKLKNFNKEKDLAIQQSSIEKVTEEKPQITVEEKETEIQNEIQDKNKLLDDSLMFVKLKNEELLKLKDSLVKEIEATRNEIHELRSQVIIDKLIPITVSPNENLSEIMDLLLKENQILQIKKINLVRQIIEQRELCIELKAKLCMNI